MNQKSKLNTREEGLFGDVIATLVNAPLMMQRKQDILFSQRWCWAVAKRSTALREVYIPGPKVVGGKWNKSLTTPSREKKLAAAKNVVQLNSM